MACLSRRPAAIAERQAEATKDQIARAARALFAEHGYAATTIAAISNAADIPVQTVYSALGSKAKILQRITDSWMVESQTVSLAKASLRETDTRQQLQLLASINRRQLELGSDVIAIYQEAARADAQMAETLHHVLAAREREIRRLSDLDHRSRARPGRGPRPRHHPGADPARGLPHSRGGTRVEPGPLRNMARKLPRRATPRWTRLTFTQRPCLRMRVLERVIGARWRAPASPPAPR